MTMNLVPEYFVVVDGDGNDVDRYPTYREAQDHVLWVLERYDDADLYVDAR